jgi:hypothetical protein
MKNHILTIAVIVGIIVIPYAIGALIEYVVNQYFYKTISLGLGLKWLSGVVFCVALVVAALIYYATYQVVSGINKHL